MAKKKEEEDKTGDTEEVTGEEPVGIDEKPILRWATRLIHKDYTIEIVGDPAEVVIKKANKVIYVKRLE